MHPITTNDFTAEGMTNEPLTWTVEFTAEARRDGLKIFNRAAEIPMMSADMENAPCGGLRFTCVIPWEASKEIRWMLNEIHSRATGTAN